MNLKLNRFVLTAMFVAVIMLLGMTPLGMLPFAIKISILAIPVVIGTILLGLKEGLVLGACFGTVSILSAFGIFGSPSLMVSNLMAKSPLLVILMSYIPRLLIPVVTHFVYRFVSGGQAESKRALPFAAVAGSLTNTVFYLGLMLLFYYLVGLDSAKVLGVIGGTGLIAGTGEAVANALITTPVMVALWKVQKKA